MSQKKLLDMYNYLSYWVLCPFKTAFGQALLFRISPR